MHKLVYITRVNPAHQSAQSIQVGAMRRAFADVLGDDFVFHLLPSKFNSAKWARMPALLRLWMFSLRSFYLSLSYSASNRKATFYTRDIVAAAAAAVVGARVVYELHQGVSSRLVRAILSILCCQPRFIIVTISGALRSYVNDNFPMPLTRILVAHDGVDLNFIDGLTRDKARLRRDLGIEADAWVVVHTGSLYKGGWGVLRDVISEDNGVTLVHIGGSEHEVLQLKKFLEPAGPQRMVVKPRVPHETAIRYQKAADCLLLINSDESPMNWCTSPLKLFEYMASGVPIAATTRGSLAEVVSDQVAFLYDESVEGSIAATLSQIKSQKKTAEEKANNAFREVRQQYTWVGRAKKIIEFCEFRQRCVA